MLFKFAVTCKKNKRVQIKIFHNFTICATMMPNSTDDLHVTGRTNGMCNKKGVGGGNEISGIKLPGDTESQTSETNILMFGIYIWKSRNLTYFGKHFS